MARILPPPLPVKNRTPDREMENDLLEFGVEPALARILASRELSCPTESKTLGRPLLSWKKMKGAAAGAEILANAIIEGRKVSIVADYDSDGATSCAICVRALRSYGALVDFAVPNRFVHGYGLTPSVVDMVAEAQSPSLIVTVDNGVSSVDGVRRAHELGIQVLVTDHHLPPEVLPEAECIIDPNQVGCEFESKNLAGCGVAFYLMAVLREELKARGKLPQSALAPSELLDLVAIGTIADVVKLDVNNRVLARMGLERIRQGKAHQGVAALFAVSRRSMPRATSKDIGFSIGPRINAAGRLEDMSVGIRCLLSDDFQEALDLALQLDDLNTKRKGIEEEMRTEAFDELARTEGLPPAGICVFGEEFHEGVIGIVAGRIKERDHRPTIVFAPAQEEGYLKGSGRSIPGFHLRDALDLIHKKKPSLLPKFGGHAMAAGMSIPSDRFDEFKEEFVAVCAALLTDDILTRYLICDGDLPAEAISLSMAERVAAEVWGQGFPEPTFCSTFSVVEQRLLKDAHLKMTLEKDGAQFGAIWFFRDSHLSSPEIEAVYSLEPSEFRGDCTVQLQIIQAVEKWPAPEDQDGAV